MEILPKDHFLKILSLPIIILVLLSLGCSLTPKATKDLALIPPERKIPLKAVIVFSKTFETLTVHQGVYDIHVGKSSVTLFKEGFSRVFEEVESLSEKPSSTDYQVLIIPEIKEARFFKEDSQPYATFRITYQISLFDPHGVAILQTSASGSGPFDPGFSRTLAIIGTGPPLRPLSIIAMPMAIKSFSASIAKPEKEAFSQLIENIRSSPKLKTYIDQHRYLF